MIVQVVNRAYRRLADLLDLPGTTSVRHIDISQAFAVQELSALLQAELVSRWLFFKEVTTGGAGSTNTSLNPFDLNWSAIERDEESSNVSVPESHEFIVTHLAVSGGNNLTSAQAWTLAKENNTQNRMAVTSNLDSQLDGILQPSGEPYYARPMPFRYNQRVAEDSLTIGVRYSGVETYGISMTGWSAPKGVFRYGDFRS